MHRRMCDNLIEQSCHQVTSKNRFRGAAASPPDNSFSRGHKKLSTLLAAGAFCAPPSPPSELDDALHWKLRSRPLPFPSLSGQNSFRKGLWGLSCVDWRDAFALFDRGLMGPTLDNQHSLDLHFVRLMNCPVAGCR